MWLYCAEIEKTDWIVLPCWIAAVWSLPWWVDSADCYKKGL